MLGLEPSSARAAEGRRGLRVGLRLEGGVAQRDLNFDAYERPEIYLETGVESGSFVPAFRIGANATYALWRAIDVNARLFAGRTPWSAVHLSEPLWRWQLGGTLGLGVVLPLGRVELAVGLGGGYMQVQGFSDEWLDQQGSTGRHELTDEGERLLLAFDIGARIPIGDGRRVVVALSAMQGSGTMLDTNPQVEEDTIGVTEQYISVTTGFDFDVL